ncbi:MAG: beta-lactamase family protein [Gemmatimonadota bacterium]|nr:beta-lactamase family protein [Gemmatimonadota bacterium]
MQKEVDSGFSGVVLVGNGDSIVLLRAYGRTGVRPAVGTAFWIGSMTKGFTAAAILKLQEDGRLALDDSLKKFFGGSPPDKIAITIRQLLTHTAGFGTTYTGGGIVGRNDAVRAILAQPLSYPPGSGYRYVDDDYELLAAIVEVVSGQPWEEYVKKRLLRPSGLLHTAFWSRPGEGDWGHRGANGMSSTAEDLFRWTRALKSVKVLSRDHVESLSARQVFVRAESPDSVYYGYGTRVYARYGRISEIMHSGSSDFGHTGIVRILPSGTTVIVLANAGSPGGTTWSSRVGQRLAIRQ